MIVLIYTRGAGALVKKMDIKFGYDEFEEASRSLQAEFGDFIARNESLQEVFAVWNGIFTLGN